MVTTEKFTALSGLIRAGSSDNGGAPTSDAFQTMVAPGKLVGK